MRVVVPALLAVLALACGGDPEAPSESQTPAGSAGPSAENQPPILSDVEILPREPSVGDTLTIAVRTRDPEGAVVRVTISWYRNGQLVDEGPSTTLSTEGYSRGERVHAIVRSSDGTHTVEKEAPGVTLVNQAPQVTRIRLLPENPNAGTDLTALADAVDHDGDSFELSYRWFVNGREVSDVRDAVLPKSSFKRGDSIEVEAVARDRDSAGVPLRSPKIVVPNGVPEIVSKPESATTSAGRYRYALRADDPDGDRPLRYKLIEGPDGMSVDLLSGIVTWPVPSNAKGKYPVEVAVSDPLGAETRQRYVVEIDWESVPADTP